jgi:predicted helicase
MAATGRALAWYHHVRNGKPAIGWVMERQTVTTDKDSGAASIDRPAQNTINTDKPVFQSDHSVVLFIL